MSKVPAADDAAFTSAYLLGLYENTFTTNDAEWTAFFRTASIAFPAGTVLFEGADLNERKDDVEIILSFRAEQNVTGQTIGDINGIAKEGHEFLWIRYKTTNDVAKNRKVKIPEAVYVERMYEESDFDDLAPAP